MGESRAMKRAFKALPLCLLLSLLFSTALSQQSKPTSEKELKLQRQRVQAITMVKQVANEAPLWDDKKAAAQALTEAADLLWDETPGQSAEWLKRAWALIDQVSATPKNETLKEFTTRSEQSELRTAVLGVARKHDPELAEKLLKQLAQKSPDEKKEHGAFDDRSARSEQLLQMAQQAVESNPDAAFSLAEQSLTDGISYSLQNVLTSLRKKQPELSNRLFDLALARFSRREPDPSEAQVLAGYLFQSGFTFSANATGQTILVMNPAQQNLPSVAAGEPQRAKSFLTAVYERILTRPVRLDTPEGKQRAQQILVLGNRVGGRYQSFAPELAQPARGFLAQLQRQLSPDGDAGAFAETARSSSSERDTTKPRSKEDLYEARIAELEDNADKERNETFKNVGYVKAAVSTKPEDYKRAQGIAEKIGDRDLRGDAVSFVLYRAALSFVERADLEKATEISPSINHAARRAVVEIAIAQRLLAGTTGTTEPGLLGPEQQQAFNLLVGLERELNKSDPSAAFAKLSLARTAVLGQLDPAQALLALDQAVQMINKLAVFDLRDGAAPDLGLAVSTTSGATVSRPRMGFNLRGAIDPLVATDFDEVSDVVGRLTTKELNGAGRLEVAKLFLRKTAPNLSNPPVRPQ
jgi:hypothetical protein